MRHGVFQEGLGGLRHMAWNSASWPGPHPRTFEPCPDPGRLPGSCRARQLESLSAQRHPYFRATFSWSAARSGRRRRPQPGCHRCVSHGRNGRPAGSHIGRGRAARAASSLCWASSASLAGRPARGGLPRSRLGRGTCPQPADPRGGVPPSGRRGGRPRATGCGRRVDPSLRFDRAPLPAAPGE